MNSRAAWVGIAVLAMLTMAGVCSAAEPNYKAGRGGLGGSLGMSSFRFDRATGNEWFGDYSIAAKNRVAIAGTFRYVANDWLRFQVNLGVAWAGYNAEVPAPFLDVRFPDDHDKGDWLTVMVPIPLQAQFVMRRGIWLYHAGAGPGVYRVWVQNHREVLKDPVTLKLHRGLYAGGSAELGVERFMSELNSTSVELTLAGHLALAQRDDQFPSGLNSNVMAMEIRIGANYYFDTGSDRGKSAGASSEAGKKP